jgi:hypothetical protein
MSITLSSLSAKLGSAVVDTDIFLVSDSTSANNNKIERSELAKSFNYLTAQNASGISLFESAGLVGLTVSGSNGFVGVNDKTPYVSLDVADNTSATNGSGQIRISTSSAARKIGISITDPNLYYQIAKQPNDTKLYLESSINNGSTFTNLMVVDQSGNFAFHGTTGALTRKFLVSGEFSEFQNSGNSIILDPYNGEIKTNATDEVFSINYNNLADIRLGYNAIYIDNDLLLPKVGINTTTPYAPLNVSGSGIVTRLDGNTNNTTLALGNTVDSGYFGVINNKTYLGPSYDDSVSNLVYSHAGEGLLGLGISAPQYKLDVNTISSETVAHFANTGTVKTCEIIIAANKAIGGADTGPRNSFATFSRYDSAVDTDKWSIGNIYNDTTFGGSDDFVFIKGGYFGTSPNVVAKLSTVGDFDIDGRFTTNSSYCKGHFIEVHNSSLTGTSNIYIDPFGVNGSSTVSSGNFNNDAPFGVSMYNGKLERVKLLTSDTIATNVVFQFYAITPAVTATNGYNNINTTGDYANVKCSGTVTLNTNQIAEIVFTTFGSFTSGQLLQFRLFKSDFTTLNIPVKVTSSLKYIII